MSGGYQLLVGPLAASLIFPEERDIFFCAVLLGGIGHNAQNVGGVGGGDLRMGGAEIRPLERANICRLGPFAKALAVVDEVFPVLFGELDGFSEDGHGFAAAADHKPGVFCHPGIVGFHQAFVLIAFGESIGVQYTDVCPADAAVHGIHVKVHTAVGDDLGEFAVRFLPIVNIGQILSGESGEIKEVSGGFKEDLGIAGPGMALPGGAIGGHIQMVTLGRPDGGIHQPIEKFVRTGEESGLLHVGIDGDGGKICRVDGEVRFYQGIPEAEDGKAGFILVQSLFAGIIHLLQGGYFFAHGQLDIGLGEFSVGIQHFAKVELDGLSRFGMDTEGNIAGDILTKVQQGFAAGGGKLLGGKAFFFHHGHIVGGGGGDAAAGQLGFGAVGRLQAGIHHFAVFIIGKADGAVGGPIPAAVGADRLHAAVGVGDLQLGQQLGLGAVLVHKTPCAGAAPVPTVRQLHGEGVAAVLEQVGHVNGLVLDPLAVVRHAGGQNEVTTALTVETGFVHTAGGDIKPCLGDIFRFKMLAEAINAVALGRIHHVIAGDPLGAPIGGAE